MPHALHRRRFPRHDERFLQVRLSTQPPGERDARDQQHSAQDRAHLLSPCAGAIHCTPCSPVPTRNRASPQRTRCSCTLPPSESVSSHVSSRAAFATDNPSRPATCCNAFTHRLELFVAGIIRSSASAARPSSGSALQIRTSSTRRRAHTAAPPPSQASRSPPCLLLQSADKSRSRIIGTGMRTASRTGTCCIEGQRGDACTCCGVQTAPPARNAALDALWRAFIAAPENR